jgi:hypothetical protein
VGGGRTSVGGNANLCSHCENRHEVPQETKNRTTIRPCYTSLGRADVYGSTVYNSQAMETA